MQSFRVLSAHFDEANDRIEVVKEITEDDGTTNLGLHTFGSETLEWKAAEYGVDDLDELLDILLHEPFMGELGSIQRSAEGARDTVRQRLAATKSKFAQARGNAKSVAVADSKSRMRLAGVDAKYIDAADEDPLEVIKRHSPFDRECIDVKRDYMEKVRQDVRVERERMRQRPSGAERAAALSKALTRDVRREAPQGLVQQAPEAQSSLSNKTEPVVLNRGKVMRSK